MEEYFTLTCQSIKLNSPHMNTICSIDTKKLYQEAIKMSIPFYRWQNWIEDYINKEFLRLVLRRSFDQGDPNEMTTEEILAEFPRQGTAHRSNHREAVQVADNYIDSKIKSKAENDEANEMAFEDNEDPASERGVLREAKSKAASLTKMLKGFKFL